MNRIKWLCTIALGVFLMFSCNDDDDMNTGGNMLPPGTEYVKEGKYCLNVFYYVPKGEDSIAGWHKNLSSVMRHVQDRFKKEMSDRGYTDRTFHLNANKQNPDYIDIIRIEGTVDSAQKDYCKAVFEEIDRYFEQHPEAKLSNHTIIFTPVSLGVRQLKFYLDSKGMPCGSSVVLPNVNASFVPEGNVLEMRQMLVRMGELLFLPYSSEPMPDAYFSIMNTNDHTNVELKKADALWLNYNQLFNDADLPYYTVKPEVKVTNTSLKYEQGNIRVACEFTSQQNIVGVIVYNDPWSTEERAKDILDKDVDDIKTTMNDAIPYAVEEVNKNGSQYKISLTIPWSDFPASYTVPGSDGKYREAEIRFRFIAEDGMSIPLPRYKGDIKSGYRYPYYIKDYEPDFDSQVNVDIPEDNEGE